MFMSCSRPNRGAVHLIGHCVAPGVAQAGRQQLALRLEHGIRRRRDQVVVDPAEIADDVELHRPNAAIKSYLSTRQPAARERGHHQSGSDAALQYRGDAVPEMPACGSAVHR